MTKLVKYMERFIATLGSTCTHTSMQPKRAYNITDHADFMDKYTTAFDEHHDHDTALACIVERHDDSGTSPILIDLDMRQDVDKYRAGERLYDHAMARAFVATYVKHLSRWVNVMGARFFLQEKPSMRLDNDRVKCGFHMVCPDILLTTHCVEKMTSTTRDRLVWRGGARLRP